MFCFPQWHKTFANFAGRPDAMLVRSGCSTSNGNVQCSPAAMAAKAAAYMRDVGWPGTVDLDTYTLARYIASEVGSGTVEEKVAVGEAARNRAKLWKLSGGTTQLLLYRQGAGHPNRGYYGPIHGPEGVQSAPYGRWAATSRDPTVGDIVLAAFVLQGSNLTYGADDQMGPEHLTYPYKMPITKGNSRAYWIGPVPGINPWHTFLVRSAPNIAPSSAAGQALIQRGIKGLEDTVALRKKKNIDWSFIPVCAPPSTNWAGLVVGGVGIVAGFLTLRRLQQTGSIPWIS